MVKMLREYFIKSEAGVNPELSRSRERESMQACHWETGKTQRQRT